MSAYVHPLDALGDPTRRSIFERLRLGPRSVGDLAAGLPVSRPAVSQHLRVLERATLVSASSNGTRRIYAVDATGLDELRAWFDTFWTDALDRFAEAAAREAATTVDETKEDGR